MNKDTLVTRFGKGTLRNQSGKAGSLIASGDTMYSFGHHWPLVRKGEWGCGIRFLHNRDSCSMRTSGHVSDTRGLEPHLSLSFKALRLAGFASFSRYSFGSYSSSYGGSSAPTPSDLQIVFMEEVPSEYEKQHYCTVCGKQAALAHDPKTYEDIPGLYKHDIWRNVPLCEGATVRTEQNACVCIIEDKEGRHWFYDGTLRLLPRRVGSTFEARAVLLPDAIREAEDRGLPYLRQGDLYAIPTDLPTRQIHGAVRKNEQPFEVTPQRVTEMRENGKLYGRGTIRGGGAMLRLPTWHLLVASNAVEVYK